ncbi:hypothetical protein [Guptibacillus hwajinpoensis]|uniref:hypothetical protein n=1 Tax=Guptibacillus hwajinpoensis TaxID=208199 RepID=UPI003D02C12F
MNRSSFYRSLQFTPEKLVETSNKIKIKYAHMEERQLELLDKTKLPDLLSEIKSLKNQKQIILDYAEKLKSINIRLLAHSYPFHNKEENETIKKISIILEVRYQKSVGSLMWAHFQLFPTDPVIVKLLRVAFSIEGENFLLLGERERSNIEKAIKEKKIIEELFNEIYSLNDSFDNVLIKHKILRGSRLEKLLWYFAMKEKIHDKRFRLREGIVSIVEKIEGLPSEKYLTVIEKYLLNVAIDDFEELILEQSIERIGDPREDGVGWDKIHIECSNKVKRWLVTKELKNFFGEDTKYKRFEYWKKHTEKVKDVYFIDEPMLAIIDFEKFVVVEFAETGNAAYFYQAKDFYHSIYYKAKHWKGSLSQLTKLLKNRKAEFFINNLVHSPTNPNPSGWHPKFDFYMRAYMNGRYDSKHR